VIVGAGTIVDGRGCSRARRACETCRRAGARASRRGRVRPRGRDGASAGRHPRHGPSGLVVDRLLREPARSLRHRLRLHATRIRDPRDNRSRGARR
jgi:hypothetical protein